MDLPHPDPDFRGYHEIQNWLWNPSRMPDLCPPVQLILFMFIKYIYSFSWQWTVSSTQLNHKNFNLNYLSLLKAGLRNRIEARYSDFSASFTEVSPRSFAWFMSFICVVIRTLFYIHWGLVNGKDPNNEIHCLSDSLSGRTLLISLRAQSGLMTKSILSISSAC